MSIDEARQQALDRAQSDLEFVFPSFFSGRRGGSDMTPFFANPGSLESVSPHFCTRSSSCLD
jgi:hypothetical protein